MSDCFFISEMKTISILKNRWKAWKNLAKLPLRMAELWSARLHPFQDWQSRLEGMLMIKVVVLPAV